MAGDLRNSDLIIRILEDQEERALEDEEIIKLLLNKKLSEDTHIQHQGSLSLGGRMADSIAKFVGSWTFIILFLVCLIGWISLNVVLIVKAVDPYPFILLNLILSCVAAIQAPVIMMSQNRQEEKDRLRSLNDYKTNLKSEIIIEDLYQRVQLMTEQQQQILQDLQSIMADQNTYSEETTPSS